MFNVNGKIRIFFINKIFLIGCALMVCGINYMPFNIETCAISIAYAGNLPEEANEPGADAEEEEAEKAQEEEEAEKAQVEEENLAQEDNEFQGVTNDTAIMSTDRATQEGGPSGIAPTDSQLIEEEMAGEPEKEQGSLDNASVKMLTISAGSATLRGGPGTKFKKERVVQKGERFEILEESSSLYKGKPWLKIKDKEGNIYYVWSSFTEIDGKDTSPEIAEDAQPPYEIAPEPTPPQEEKSDMEVQAGSADESEAITGTPIPAPTVSTFQPPVKKGDTDSSQKEKDGFLSQSNLQEPLNFISAKTEEILTANRLNEFKDSVSKHPYYKPALLIVLIVCIWLFMFFKKINRLKDSEAKYLTRSVLLKESQNPYLYKMIIWFCGLTITCFVIWASNMQVDEIASAIGEITPTGKVQQIQHSKGGIISEILVEDGEFVEKDQVLMKLDPVISESQLGQTRSQMNMLFAQRARLKKMINYASSGKKVVDDSGPPAPSGSGLSLEQNQIFRQQVASYNSGRLILLHQKKQLSEELKSLEQRNSTLKEQEKILNSEATIKKKLVEEGLFSQLEYLNVERKLSSIQGELEQIDPNKNKVNEKINEITNRLREYASEVIKKNSIELSEVNNKLNQLNQINKRDTQSFQQLNIRAPVGGLVHGLTKHTLGGVINPSETIMKIVPRDRLLIAEVQISSKDIGHVKIGQNAMLKFTTYNYGRYGGIKGLLQEISATTFVNTEGQPFYKGTISLEKDYVGFNPKSNKVIPGMTVQADIKTGSKTILQYLFKPIYTTASQAMRER